MTAGPMQATAPPRNRSGGLVIVGDEVEFDREPVSHCVVETVAVGAEELALRAERVRERHLEFEVDAVFAVVAEGALQVLADFARHYNSLGGVQRPESTRAVAGKGSGGQSNRSSWSTQARLPASTNRTDHLKAFATKPDKKREVPARTSPSHPT